MNYWLVIALLGLAVFFLRWYVWPRVGVDADDGQGSHSWRRTFFVRLPLETLEACLVVGIVTYSLLGVWLAAIDRTVSSPAGADWLLARATMFADVAEQTGALLAIAIVVVASVPLGTVIALGLRGRSQKDTAGVLDRELKSLQELRARYEAEAARADEYAAWFAEADKRISELAADHERASQEADKSAASARRVVGSRVWKLVFGSSVLGRANGMRQAMTVASGVLFALSLIQLEARPIGERLALRALAIDFGATRAVEEAPGLPRDAFEQSADNAPPSDDEYQRASENIIARIVARVPPEHDAAYERVFTSVRQARASRTTEGPSPAEAGNSNAPDSPSTRRSEASGTSEPAGQSQSADKSEPAGRSEASPAANRVERDLRACGPTCGPWVKSTAAASPASAAVRPVAESLADLLLVFLKTPTVGARYSKELLSKGLTELIENASADHVTTKVDALTKEAEAPRRAKYEPPTPEPPVSVSPSGGFNGLDPTTMQPIDNPFGLQSARGIEVLGRDECSRTAEIRKYLDARKVPYRYRNVDTDALAAVKADSLVRLNKSSGLLPILIVDGRFRSLEGTAEENTILMESICRR